MFIVFGFILPTILFIVSTVIKSSLFVMKASVKTTKSVGSKLMEKTGLDNNPVVITGRGTARVGKKVIKTGKKAAQVTLKATITALKSLIFLLRTTAAVIFIITTVVCSLTLIGAIALIATLGVVILFMQS